MRKRLRKHHGSRQAPGFSIVRSDIVWSDVDDALTTSVIFFVLAEPAAVGSLTFAGDLRVQSPDRTGRPAEPGDAHGHHGPKLPHSIGRERPVPSEPRGLPGVTLHPKYVRV